MLYSSDNTRNLYLDIDRIIKRDKRDNVETNLEDLKKRLRKQFDFQEKCENGGLLGDLLLKCAIEYDGLDVKDFLLKNGCKLLPQEQMVDATNGEESKQDVPKVEEKVNSVGAQPNISYTKVEQILAEDPNIQSQEFYNELKKEIGTDIKIFDLFVDAIRSEGSGVSNNRTTFLKAVELLVRSQIKINSLKNTTSKNLLDIAGESKQFDVLKILLDSNRFNEAEKLNALLLTITQGNTQEACLFLNYVNMKDALNIAMGINKEEITDAMLKYTPQITPAVEEMAEPSSNNGSVGSGSTAEIPTTGLESIPQITPRVEEMAEPSGNNGSATAPAVGEECKGETNADQTEMTSEKGAIKNSDSLTDSQPYTPNETKSKYKESRQDFLTSLGKDGFGVIVTGLLISAAVMAQPVFVTAAFSILAALAVTLTLLHVKNSTLPSYREMQENRVESPGAHSKGKVVSGA